MTEHKTDPNESLKYLTKRELFAAMAMMGAAANSAVRIINFKVCVVQADALIEALNQKGEPQ